MSENAVLFVGGRPESLRFAVELGLTVVNVQIPEYSTREDADRVAATVLIDYTDWPILAAVAGQLAATFGCTRVISMTEPGTVPAARLREHLGLPGNSLHVSQTLKDKVLMRRALVGSGLAEVPADYYAGAASLTGFGDRHGYPFVVKPADATASLHVRMVRSPAEAARCSEFADAALHSAEHRYAKVFPLTKFMIEGFIDGPEYSIETLSFDGRHVVVALTEKLTGTGFVELGHATPAGLTREQAREAAETVTRFLDVIGLRQGPAHTEAKLTPAGWVVVESHDRPGGDRIIDLVERVHGINLEQYGVGWPTGRMPAFDVAPGPRTTAATRFLTARPGQVTRIDGTDAACSAPGAVAVHVDVQVGAVVPELRGNWDRIGQVIATGDDVGQAMARAADMASLIDVHTEEER